MEGYQTTVYQIADIRLRLDTPWKEKNTEAFAPFVKNTEGYDWMAVFRPGEQKDLTDQAVIFQNDAFRVFRNEQGAYVRRYYNRRFAEKGYATAVLDTKGKKVEITYLPEAAGAYIGSAKLDFFHIALEKILIEENALILHAACVDTVYGGILFSGVSGAGKSTQAELWCRYGKGRLINGDRPIVKRNADGWSAYGSPYAGSSGCHLDESCKIRAIVLPKKSDKCSLRKVEDAEKFRKVFGNLTLNLWDTDFVLKASDLIREMLSEIPVYELECTMEQEAVFVLEKLLEKEREQWRKRK